MSKKKKDTNTLNEQKQEVRLDKDIGFDDSFYKGVGGEYTVDELGRRVPVSAKGE